MRILEIEEKFKSIDTLEEVLTELEGDFDQIENYASDIKENILNNPEEMLEALNKLTGIFMHLRPVLGIAETKSLSEARNFQILKALEETGLTTGDGKKINSLTYFTERAKREARGDSEPYLRITNILKGYVDSCERSISVLQSQLKYLKKEYNAQGN